MRRPSNRLAAIAFSAACLAGALLAAPPLADAAVRVCAAPVSSGVKEGKSEAEARRLAMTGWIEAARMHGQGYMRWELAEGRRVGCAKGAGGNFQCAAVGRPCSIQQVPPKRPQRRAPGVIDT